ncbi:MULTISPECIES: glycosyltransferase [Achromobacter]|uniref:Glycosyl transferase n=1 Tax=Alcaligenes xylosoxydans xylosoxydans TaxID=85698 RepID=A0A424W972_ALCXX|nr:MULTISPECIES: glycosyltransferase [Achromobacter]MBC9906818.1 glycosyltransferase family 4 protein [Achromobacter xylosoxidans]MBD0870518.1 glycosyltransferase family 4 protein [Achromobacter xylosoxidans]QNP85765.1 glycosyltransferase family 4 protein [Achromobacter xylosoxidans]RPJ89760.1 glycosyl transferase [Achromobacter xylosoxidans]
MLYLLVAFLVSLIVTMLLVRFNALHGHFFLDHETKGVQKYHDRPVPRVGGISLVCAMALVMVLATLREPTLDYEPLILLAVSMPAFLGGLAEDFTKKVRVLSRLMFAMISGMAAYYFLGATLDRLNIVGVDWLLQFGPISFVVTAIAIAGAANAINIIDGYNGLAAVVSVMIFAGFAYVSYYIGDRLLLTVSVGMMGAIVGFLVWNYPRGLIFLGDGGAYFIGFMIGVVSVLMIARHPNVSAWFPLLLCIYPVFETLFSMYRKKLLRGQSPGLPDGVHLHMLIYKRLVRWAVGSSDIRRKTQRNAMTSPYLWLLSSFAVLPAVLFWQNELLLMLFVVLFSALYIGLYRRLVLFRMPKWMVISQKQRAARAAAKKSMRKVRR